MYTEAYKKLERSLTDNIAEAQAKLGYSKNTMQFYYPLRTLNHFFNSEWKADKMNKALQEFIDFVAPRFGKTSIEQLPLLMSMNIKRKMSLFSN